MLAGAAVLTAGLYGGAGTVPPAAAAPATSAPVNIQNFAYSPTPLTVAVGTTVTWTNKDPGPHSVTSDTGAFDSSPANCSSSGGTGCIQPTTTFSNTFGTAGTFNYHCRVHSVMHGTIVVG